MPRRAILGLAPTRFAVVVGVVVVLGAGAIGAHALMLRGDRHALRSQVDLVAESIAGTVEYELSRQRVLLEAEVDTWLDESPADASALGERLRPLESANGRFHSIAVVIGDADKASFRVTAPAAEDFELPTGLTADQFRAARRSLLAPAAPASVWVETATRSPAELHMLTRAGDNATVLSVFPISTFLADVHPTLCPNGFGASIRLGGEELANLDGGGPYAPYVGRRPAGRGVEVEVRATREFAEGHRNRLLGAILVAGFAVAGLGGVLAYVWLRGIEERELLGDRYRRLYNAAPVLYHALDSSLHILEANTTECETLGYTPEALVGRPLRDVLETLPEFLTAARDGGSSGKVYTGTARYRRRDGAFFDADIVAVRDSGEVGERRWLMVGHDATERRRREVEEARARHQVNFLSRVVEKLYEGVMALDETGRVLYANPAAERSLGGGDAIAGRGLAALLGSREEAERIWKSLGEALGGGESWQEKLSLSQAAGGTSEVLLRLGGTSVQDDGRRAIVILVRNVSKEAALTRELAESQEKYRTIFNKAPIGVLVLNERGEAVDANGFHRRYLARLLDLGEDGKTASVFTNAPLITAGVHRRFHELYEGRELDLSEVRIPARPGTEERVMSIRGVPERDQAGQITGAILFVEDITARHRYSEQMRSQAIDLAGERERALESSRLKSQFIATISHELRTPLNAIIGFSRIIARKGAGQLDDRLMQNVSKIQESAERQLHLINDLLDISKIEAGRLEVNYETIPLASLFESLRSQAEALMERNGNSLSMDTPSHVETIEADPVRMQQILLNLLGNAAKFTNDGQVIVTTESMMREVEPGDGKPVEWVEIAVQDSGIGIANDQLRDIFEEFYQADGSATRNYGGTGLGLAISKRLARLMHGEIRVESQIGFGSTFTLSLPRFAPPGAKQDERAF